MTRYLRAQQKVRRVNRRWRDFIYLGLGVVVLVIPMLLIAAKQNRLVTVGYGITDLRRETEALAEQQTHLRAELAELTRPDRVFKKALEMGLVPVGQNDRLLVRRLENQPTTQAPEMIAHSGESSSR